MGKVSVIIPAFNEEKSIGKVLADIPRDMIKEIVVVNNASSDQTYRVALDAGATVIDQPVKGYGNACLKGIEHIDRQPTEEQPEIIVFLDADYSDYPSEMPSLTKPIFQNDYDMVIGSRALGNREKGSMAPQQIFGNWLAGFLIDLMYGFKYSDLGPFRAIKWEKLKALQMNDKTFGWTVEMQVKAVKHKLKITEIPVSYRRRIGVSKVTGTIYGSFTAGVLIIYTIFKYSMSSAR